MSEILSAFFKSLIPLLEENHIVIAEHSQLNRLVLSHKSLTPPYSIGCIEEKKIIIPTSSVGLSVKLADNAVEPVTGIKNPESREMDTILLSRGYVREVEGVLTESMKNSISTSISIDYVLHVPVAKTAITEIQWLLQDDDRLRRWWWWLPWS